MIPVKTILSAAVVSAGMIFFCTPVQPIQNRMPTQIWFTDSSGRTQFKATDASLYYTAQNTYLDAGRNPFKVFEAEVMKVSGYDQAFFGILFCGQPGGDYYQFLINLKGQYFVTREQGGGRTAFISNQNSTKIRMEYNKVDTLKVTRDTVTSRFTLYINGDSVNTFKDSTWTGGDIGFVACIDGGTNEQFPQTPEDVRFRKINP